MIFVSGAVLEYTYPYFRDFEEISAFYVRRLFRIYPAFWMSLIVGLAICPFLLHRIQPHILVLEFTGFCAFVGQWSRSINYCGWFVGLIVTLYFLYPFLSASIRKYPFLMLFLIAVSEIALRYTFTVYHPAIFGLYPDRWFPVCNFLEFGLGIWIIQQDVFPKWRYDNTLIEFLAGISFYVFLIHLIAGMPALMLVSLPVYFVVIILLAWLMMLGDEKIQFYLKRVAGI
jgi:peptidoglycan/LPS O-acetylase OafA/YrhL